MIKLSIEIVSPLTPDDRDLLSGVAVMTLAIANHEMAKAAFPEVFADEDEEDADDDGEPMGEIDEVADTAAAPGLPN